MRQRESIQKKHEQALTQDFLCWFNSQNNTNFVVVDEPDPPDAIISSDEATRWIEVTDDFYSAEYARDLYSFATPGERHVPMRSGIHVNMDEQFASRFVQVLENKLSKKSYLPFRDKFNPGILIIGMQSPWFDAGTVRLMKSKWEAIPRNDFGYFSEVYLAFQSMNKRAFQRWELC